MRFYFLLTLFLCNVLDATDIASKVIAATVFKERAQITRMAKFQAKKGVQKVFFKNLTTDLIDASVRIKNDNTSGIKILDVQVERRFTTVIQNEKMAAMQKSIDSLRYIFDKTVDEITVLENKKAFVEGLKAESLKYANQKILMNTSSTKNWKDMLGFVDKNLTDIYTGIRNLHVTKRQLEKELKTRQKKMNKVDFKQTTDTKEITVQVEVAKAGTYTLYPTYIVKDASWYPLYDARVTSQSGDLELTYYAMVRQTTGEDWNDIRLSFSTAEPLTSKALPELEAWHLSNRPLQKKQSTSTIRSTNPNIQYTKNYGLPKGKGVVSGHVRDSNTGEALIGVQVYVEGTKHGAATDEEGYFYINAVPAKHQTLIAEYVGYNKTKIKLRVVEKSEAQVDLEMEEAAIDLEQVVVAAMRPLVDTKQTASVSVVDLPGSFKYNGGRSARSSATLNLPEFSDVAEKELTTTFTLKTKNTIPSDHSPHKVTVSMGQLPLNYTYKSIPKLKEAVFLKGNVKNTNDYPLLAGEMNIFVDNDFINRTYIDAIAPTDTFALALSTDDNIRVERKRLNRFTEQSGILNKEMKITYSYEIYLKNNHRKAVTIHVTDQIPLSMHEDIEIELVTPKRTKKELGKDKTIEWQVPLEPGEEKTLPLKFVVTYKAGVNVFGLE
jgi:hypothetical protein